MKSKHIFLDLVLISFPITAITSIIHRITGILLFFSIPIILYFLDLSLKSNSSFDVLKVLMCKSHIKILLLLLLFSFLYHLINGIKHMVMELGFFDSKSGSKKFTVVFLFITVFLFILSFICLY